MDQRPDLPGLSDASSEDAGAGNPIPGAWGSLAILEKLGEGSFGVVYRAYDPSLQRQVALKLLRVAPGPSHELLEEAKRLARVRHANVLIVHGADLRDGAVGIWTELIAGATLEDYLAQNGPMGASEARAIGLDLCRALAAVHAHGLVHRDLKASNVMREHGGRIVLMDFGSVGISTTTSSDNIYGTPLTMAPEQLLGGPVGPTADIFGLGTLLYRLTSGQYPLEARSVPELVEKHRAGAAIPLRDRRPDLPTDFVQVVDRATQSDPDARFPSAGAMERALSASTGTAAPVRRERAFEVQIGKWFKMRYMVATVSALVVTSVLLVTRLTVSRKAPPPERVESAHLRDAGPRADAVSPVPAPVVPPPGAQSPPPASVSSPPPPVTPAAQAVVPPPPAVEAPLTKGVTPPPATTAATTSPPTETAPARPAAGQALLRVSTEPPGATVSIDGHRQSRPTNSSFPVGPGTHRLAFEKTGFYPQDMEVADLGAGESRAVGATLKPMSGAGLGQLVLHIKPTSKIFVDGVMVSGAGGEQTLKLAAGARVVRAENALGQQSWTETIPPNGTATIDYDFAVALKAAEQARAQGSVKVVTSGHDGARVLMDGKDTGLTTPCTIEHLAPGDHSVSVTLDGYTPDHPDITVTVRTGATADVMFKLKKHR